MEIAVLAHDGHAETGRWCGLVRPRAPIAPFAQRITGITPQMLQQAPSFSMIASRLRSLLRDRVMVAHNARYDRVVLQHEFARTGLPFHPASLCTERLTRQLVPGLVHYNLGNLCRHFGIARDRQHRAEDDASATLALLCRLLQEHGSERVLAAVEPAALLRVA